MLVRYTFTLLIACTTCLQMSKACITIQQEQTNCLQLKEKYIFHLLMRLVQAFVPHEWLRVAVFKWCCTSQLWKLVLNE